MEDKIKELHDLVMITKWLIPMYENGGQAARTACAYWVFGVIKAGKETMNAYRSIAAYPIIEEDTINKDELIKQMVEKGWEGLKKQLDNRHIKIYSDLEPDKLIEEITDFDDIKLYKEIPKSWEGELSFYYK